MLAQIMRSFGVLAFCILMACSAQAAVSDFQAGEMTVNGVSWPYRLYVPDNYDPSRSYPLTLFLHGAGGRGTDNIRNANEASALLPAFRQEGHESFILAPQLATSDNTWWTSGPLKASMNTIDDLIGQYNIDADRLYMTGVSLGGHGTWQGMCNFTDRFAAGVVVCGWYNTGYAYRLKDKPMWVFHGAQDNTVGVQSARNMVNAMESAGGQPKYTEYPDAGHGIAGRVYGTDELYDWLFAQELGWAPGARLTCQTTALGGGLTGYTFYLEANDAEQLNYTATLAFEGVEGAMIRQTPLNGTFPIHTQSMAEMADGMNGYEMALDSWVFDPFAANPSPGTNPLDGGLLSGIEEGDNTFTFSCRGDSPMGSGIPVAYVVADGAVRWTGTINRGGKSYDTTGVVPEPTTLALIALAVPLLRGRRGK